MKPKLTFLLSLTFLFLFSGSATAGIFSPDDYYECVFKSMRKVENDFAAVHSNKSCADKFPGKRKKGNSGLFGPKNKNDCFLKYSKGVKNDFAVIFIKSACDSKFGKKVEVEKIEEKKELKFNFE
jgi:hypothetical protein